MSSTDTEDRYRAVFAEHHRQIYAYFRRRIDPETASDCMAETFLVAWRRIDDVPDDERQLRWLYTVARNVLRNAYRTKRRSRVAPAPIDPEFADPHDGPEDLALRRETDREVLEAVERLSERDREVLLLSLWEELPREDVAAIVGCSPHAASQRLHRASRRLARELSRPSEATTGAGEPRRQEGWG